MARDGARAEVLGIDGLRPGDLGSAARGRRHSLGHCSARGCLLSGRRLRGVGWARASPPPRFSVVLLPARSPPSSRRRGLRCASCRPLGLPQRPHPRPRAWPEPPRSPARSLVPSLSSHLQEGLMLAARWVCSLAWDISVTATKSCLSPGPGPQREPVGTNKPGKGQVRPLGRSGRPLGGADVCITA